MIIMVMMHYYYYYFLQQYECVNLTQSIFNDMTNTQHFVYSLLKQDHVLIPHGFEVLIYTKSQKKFMIHIFIISFVCS